MKRALVAALLSALATAAVLATVGFGANSTATTASKKKSSHSSQAAQSGPPKTLKQVYDEQQTRRAAQDKKLADALGVSADDLTKAQDTIFKDHLDAQVKANTLTQAQADAILACKAAPLTCDRSNLPAGGPGGPRGRHDKGGPGNFAADLAKALGIDQSKVESALKSVQPARPAWPKGARPTAGGMPTAGGIPGGHGFGPHGHGGPDGPPGGGPGGPPGGGPGGPGGFDGGYDGASAPADAQPTVSA
jgi:hypothetical protein